jgi:hypothetical protein
MGTLDPMFYATAFLIEFLEHLNNTGVNKLISDYENLKNANFDRGVPAIDLYKATAPVNRMFIVVGQPCVEEGTHETFGLDATNIPVRPVSLPAEVVVHSGVLVQIVEGFIRSLYIEHCSRVTIRSARTVP